MFSHILGDFYLQNTYISKNKSSKKRYYILHCILYALSCFLVAVPVWNTLLIILLTVLALSHAFTDAIKILVQKIVQEKTGNHYSDKNYEALFFLTDQMLHAIFILGVSIYAADISVPVTEIGPISNWLTCFNVSYLHFIKILILILGNIRPCNILINMTVKFYKPPITGTNQNQSSSQITGAGTIIGTLERYLITIFFVIEQYSLIGLVLTAKSIARYSQLDNDKNFAEYYLMGTLLSTLFTLVLCLLVI